MHRRDFLVDCTAAVWCGQRLLTAGLDTAALQAGRRIPGAGVAGQPVDLARCGNLRSWLSPQATALLKKTLGSIEAKPAELADAPWNKGELDVGVEWPEFRYLEKVVIRYSGREQAPRISSQYLEYWAGMTPRQGEWKPVEGESAGGTNLRIEGPVWTFPLPKRRTCKLRLRLQNEEHVSIEGFEVYGPSTWKMGEVHIEWGHLGQARKYDGKLEIYNGEVMDIHAVGDAQITGPLSWASSPGKGRLGGITARVLYTHGMSVDRTVLTVRAESGDYSFLPHEALEDQPIDLSDFGVYIRNHDLAVDRASYRARNAGRSRIIKAVCAHPEQTLENAYQQIRSKRVTLSFVGFDSNNQKFGIAPDGHVVIGNNDPSCGAPMQAKHAVYFDSAARQTEGIGASSDIEGLFSNPAEKRQEPEEGWLPVLVTRWGHDDLSFQRTDFVALPGVAEPIDETGLTGIEPAVLISRLQIRNDSPVASEAHYYIKPWKPSHGQIAPQLTEYGPTPKEVPNAWSTALEDDLVVAQEGNLRFVICKVDMHGLGSLSLAPVVGAVCYSTVVKPGEERVIHTMIPGQPLPLGDVDLLKGLSYERLHDLIVQYWKGRLAEGMQVEVPDRHLQNLYNASLHHFLLALTKDIKRGEHYANTAVFDYGIIGSESSPIIQALDMRGMRHLAESCLQPWLSTQGDSLAGGDYHSKEGGFYHFWPFYTINQGPLLWTMAEHYLVTRDKEWLARVAPQIVSGCDFILRERKHLIERLSLEPQSLEFGLAPSGAVCDMRDWQYSFMLNGCFYLGLNKAAQVLKEIDPANSARIAAGAEDYRKAILRALKESIAISPVTRLRDNTSVPAVPSYLGLRGYRFEVKDIEDLGYGEGVVMDIPTGPFHLLKSGILHPDDPEVAWMLDCYEDRFFLESPVDSPVELDRLSTDWFNLGGFEKLQPYYLHYQEAYLQRDQIPNFVRGFYNTLAAISDPQTLTFRESLIYSSGSEPNKTHEEAWFFHQFRQMLMLEMGRDLHLARGTPREWLKHGNEIAVSRAPSYFGEVAFRIRSFSNDGRLEAIVNPPRRERPANLFLRLRHPAQAPLQRVVLDGRAWTKFDVQRETIQIPVEPGEVKVVAYY